MKTHHHALISPILLILYPWLGNYTFLVMFSSVVIDLDHIQFILKEKTLNFKKLNQLTEKIYRDYKEDPSAHSDIIYLFHSIEFNFVLCLMAFWSPIFFYISLGFVFHILIDIIHHKTQNIPILKWLLISTSIFKRDTKNK